jgi:WD40 repeat protein
MSRRLEIEAKRQRLAELRRLREEKDRQKLDQDTTKDKTATDIGNGFVNITAASNPKAAQYAEISVQTETEAETDAVPDTVKKTQPSITYNKSTQTIDADLSDEEIQIQTQTQSQTAQPQQQLRSEIEPAPVDETDTQQEVETTQIDDETLSEFLQQSFKVLSRVIDDDQEILKSYSKTKKKAIESSKNHLLYKKLSLDSKSIYSIDTSPFSSDLSLISTGCNVFLYNSKSQKFEMEFYSSTKIINVQFAHFNSNLIIGTGYNGKVSIWDLNQRPKLKNFPILESTVSKETHAYPIWVLLQIHNDKNNDIILTASTDGCLITWDPQILAKPRTDPYHLTVPKKLNLMYDELTPLCAIQMNTTSNNKQQQQQQQQKRRYNKSLLLGAEDGNIYRLDQNFEYINKIGTKSSSSSSSSSSDNDLIDAIFEGHTGPIQDLDASIEFPNLFISCSMDWKIHLWDVYHPQKPLLTIYKTDSIMGCKWRPNHPTQLGYIYEDRFELLDLSINTVNPILQIKADSAKTLNRLAFDKEGNFAYLSDIDGTLHIYELLLDDIHSEPAKFKRRFASSSSSSSSSG